MLPTFRYHPDPVSTGSIEASDAVCECCGKARGFIYTLAVLCMEDVEAVCPWCIADGSVHRKYDAVLNDDHPLVSAGLPDDVIEEVTQRTPGYVSWQQESWLHCCGDACEFHGDAPRQEIRALDSEDIDRLEPGFAAEDLVEVVKHYEPGGSPAFYKFMCRHCRRVRYGWDCD